MGRESKGRLETHSDGTYELSGNSQKIGVKSTKSQSPKRQGQVLIGRSSRQLKHQTNDIDRPQIIVRDGFPQELPVNCLPIVHVPFGRVITENPVHHDDLLALVEPAPGAVPGASLGGRRRHHEPRPDAYDQSEQALDEEQPAPALVAMEAAEAEESEGKDGCDHVDDSEGCPEKGEAEGEFGSFKEV